MRSAVENGHLSAREHRDVGPWDRGGCREVLVGQILKREGVELGRGNSEGTGRRRNADIARQKRIGYRPVAVDSCLSRGQGQLTADLFDSDCDPCDGAVSDSVTRPETVIPFSETVIGAISANNKSTRTRLNRSVITLEDYHEAAFKVMHGKGSRERQAHPRDVV